MFIAEAILFYVPRAIWRMLSLKAGLSLYAITDTAADYQSKSDPKKLDQMMSFMTRTLKKYILERNKKRAASKRGKCFHGNYLICLYIFVKLLYVFNVLGQLCVLNVFLGTNFYSYGIDVLRRMLQGDDWTSSSRFPRTALCDFRIRTVGNVHRYTVQCSLPANLLNEMFFIVLWFWFFFVLSVTTISLFTWLYKATHAEHRVQFVRNRLYALQRIHRRAQTDASEEDRQLDEFVGEFLRRDGFLVVCLVAKNSSDVIAAEITGGLWDWYNKTRQPKTIARGPKTTIVEGDEEEEKDITSSKV